MDTRTRNLKVSKYARLIPSHSDSGAYLYSSFMGALAYLNGQTLEQIRPLLKSAFEKHRETQPTFTIAEDDHDFIELERQGFVVPVELDEEAAVEKLLMRERDYGTHFIILPHEDCNFRCTYCYETFERGKMEQGTVEAVKRLAEAKVPNANLFNVGWFGGEPCLARDIIDDLSQHFQMLCAKFDVPYRASITTNGYLLNDAMLGMLLERGVKHFQVTIDGSEPAHNAARKRRLGGETYRRIFDNLVRMVARKEDFTVAIRVNFNPETIATIEDFLKEASCKFAEDSRFFLDFHAVGRWGGPNDTTMTVVDERSAASARLSLVEDSHCHGFAGTSVLDGLKPHGASCYAGKASSLVIGSDGKLYKCTVAFQDARNQIGQLRSDGSLDIDNEKWRLWTEPRSTSGKCGTCSFYGACQSRACPLAMIEHGEPPCPHTDSDFEKLINFAAQALRNNTNVQHQETAVSHK